MAEALRVARLFFLAYDPVRVDAVFLVIFVRADHDAFHHKNCVEAKMTIFKYS